MAKRNHPATPRPAHLNPDQMRAAIPLLERRLAEIEALDPNSASSRRDVRFAEAELKLEDTLVTIFGNDTAEYQRFRVGSLDRALVVIGQPPNLQELREGFSRGKQHALTNLQTILALFKEKLGTAGETSASAVPT